MPCAWACALCSDVPTAMRRFLVLTLQTAAAAVAAAGLLSWWQPQLPQQPRSEQPTPAEVIPATVPAALSYRSAVRSAMPSVVNIYTSTTVRGPRSPWLEPPGFYDEDTAPPTSSLGSGVVWRADGLIVTNNHVIEGADQIAVAIEGKQPLLAKVVGTDPESDLALLRVPAVGLAPMAPGASSGLEVGDVVLAIGNPFGVGQTVTQGIVSATRRRNLGINTFEDFIQTDAAINPGNSGGALVDTAGRLIGINTAIYTRSEGSIGIGFAIPVEVVDRAVQDLLQSGQVRRGYLGIQTVDVSAELAQRLGASAAGGAAIAAVDPRGPAGRAGLQPGDVIRRIGSDTVTDGADLVSRTGSMKPGETARLQIERRGDTLMLEVRLAQRPPRKRAIGLP